VPSSPFHHHQKKDGEVTPSAGWGVGGEGGMDGELAENRKRKKPKWLDWQESGLRRT